MSEKSLLPFLILGAGLLWMALLKWLRHRSLSRSGTENPAPNAQNLDLIGAAGLFLCMTAAAIVAYVKWLQ